MNSEPKLYQMGNRTIDFLSKSESDGLTRLAGFDYYKTDDTEGGKNQGSAATT